MVESNIGAGNQSIPEDLNDLQYGVSVTDACVDWQTTETMIRDLRSRVKDSLGGRTAMNTSQQTEKSA
jgi:3-deoxy-7-phosphoheptulonate synthase